MSLFQPRLLVVGTAAAAVALPGQFVGRFTTPAELSESFNVVAPQPLKPLLMHHLLRQPDWRRSLVLVNWNEAAHQLELPLSMLGARVTKAGGIHVIARHLAVAIKRKLNRNRYWRDPSHRRLSRYASCIANGEDTN